ncbi:MAG: gliding motility-associated C-terminal domain-containing protein, partial [Bacteroidales bacterium]|nr:gliding motility-associated C-terminal domain-containing protein [Bacteroidales bacterium]
HYHLHVWWNVSTTYDSALCENYLPITWNGRTFTSTGTQQAVLVGSHGVDSTVTMRFRRLVNTHHTQRDTVVENSLPVRYAGLTFGTDQRDTTLVRVNAAGCDSLIHYSLHVWRNVYNTVDSTLCENFLPLTWNGVSFADDDSSQIILMGNHGVDSILTMRVHVLRNTYLEHHDTVVENRLPVRFAGLVFVAPRADTLLRRVNSAGCDSLITFSLFVHWNYHMRYDTMVCRNYTPLVWRDSLFRDSDVKNTLLMASTGADSLITLKMQVNDVYDTSVDASICFADNYYVGDNAFKHEGDYDVMLSSIYGCDSMVHLSLTVYETFFYQEYDTICDNQQQYFEGQYFQKAGTYVVNRYTTYGCDSVLTLFLATKPSYDDTDYVVICYGERYVWSDSDTYDRSTSEPRMHYFASNDCDSLRTLNLQVDQPVHAAIKASPTVVAEVGQDVTLSDISINDSLRWWFFDGELFSRSPQLVYPFPPDRDTLHVVLAVESALGCRDTATVTIYNDMVRIWAPSVFTPTLPSNNKFIVQGYNIGSFECRIYNRQGLLVYHSRDISSAWDGTHGGTLCSQGAYIYHVTYTSLYQPKETRKLTGSVLLMR